LFGLAYLSLSSGISTYETVWGKLWHVHKLFSTYFNGGLFELIQTCLPKQGLNLILVDWNIRNFNSEGYTGTFEYGEAVVEEVVLQVLGFQIWFHVSLDVWWRVWKVNFSLIKLIHLAKSSAFKIMFGNYSQKHTQISYIINM